MDKLTIEMAVNERKCQDGYFNALPYSLKTISHYLSFIQRLIITNHINKYILTHRLFQSILHLDIK